MSNQRRLTSSSSRCWWWWWLVRWPVHGSPVPALYTIARPLPANIYSHAACTSAGIPWYTGTPSAGWPGPAACGEIKPFGCLLVAGGWPGCPAPPLRPAIIINNVATTIHSYTVHCEPMTKRNGSKNILSYKNIFNFFSFLSYRIGILLKLLTDKWWNIPVADRKKSGRLSLKNFFVDRNIIANLAHSAVCEVDWI